MSGKKVWGFKCVRGTHVSQATGSGVFVQHQLAARYNTSIQTKRALKINWNFVFLEKSG